MRQGVVPTAITYKALVSACERDKRPEQALTVFEALMRQEVVPTAVTYDALTSACEKGQRPE